MEDTTAKRLPFVKAVYQVYGYMLAYAREHDGICPMESAAILDIAMPAQSPDMPPVALSSLGTPRELRIGTALNCLERCGLIQRDMVAGKLLSYLPHWKEHGENAARIAQGQYYLDMIICRGSEKIRGVNHDGN